MNDSNTKSLPHRLLKYTEPYSIGISYDPLSEVDMNTVRSFKAAGEPWGPNSRLDFCQPRLLVGPAAAT